MYQRYLKLDIPQGQSCFLWGARRTGKSTFLQANWPDAIRTYREDLRRHAAVDAELSEYLPRLLGYLAKATE